MSDIKPQAAKRLSFLLPGPLRPLVYFFVMLVYQEEVFRIFALGKAGGIGLLFILVFSTSAAFVCAALCCVLPPKVNFVLAAVLSAFTLFFYGSQLVYNKIFYTYYTFFSAANGGKAFQFWTVIVSTLTINLVPILLLAVPLGLLLWRGRRWLLFPRCPLPALLVGLLGAGALHLAGVGLLHVTGRAAFSPYDLYYNTSALNYSVDRLGMLTSMRLDIQRYLVGFEPKLDIPEQEPPIVREEDAPYEPNILSIDFEELIAAEPDELIANMHRYFLTIPPSYTNEKTGLFEGDNLILLVGETFSALAVDEKRTPTLYKMANEGFLFTDFYVPLWGCSTSDGEYTTLQSLLPKAGVWSMYTSYQNDLPFTLGNQFKARGYTAHAYHDHEYDYYMRHLSHPNLGYDYKGLGNGLELTRQWPESDLEMMEATIPEYIGNPPFHTYYMTVSGHLGYNFYDNAMAVKHRDTVADLPLSDEAKAYLSCNVELDRAMEKLLDALEAAGLAENTVISLSPDHYPYGLSQGALNELWGHQVEQNFEMYKTCYILYKKGMTPQVVDRPCSSLDILPTLSNLFGLPFDSRLMMGTDVFSTSDPLVIFDNRSWITAEARYNASTGQVESMTGAEVDPAYVERINRLVNNKFVFSTKILETDYYAQVVDGKDQRQAANAMSAQRNNIPGAGQGPFGPVFGSAGMVPGERQTPPASLAGPAAPDEAEDVIIDEDAAAKAAA